jgi:hypothetical protein
MPLWIDSKKASRLSTLAGRAERGELTTISEIRNAWEQQIGQRVSRSTVYRLLHRHGWRKLTPVPAIQKRTQPSKLPGSAPSPIRFRRLCPHATQRISGPCARWPKMKAALDASADPGAPGHRQGCVRAPGANMSASLPMSMPPLRQSRAR